MRTLEPIGSEHTLPVYRFGPAGRRPRVYLQGGLHANEVSSTFALIELVGLLTKRQRRIQSEITVVPHCNPIGFGQFVHGLHHGRFDLSDGQNFNRKFPDISTDVISELRASNGEHSDEATALEKGNQILAGRFARSPGEQLKQTLLLLSWGADVVIDVHADMEALVHMYCSESSWPRFKRLAQLLAVQAVVLGDISADNPFDEAHSYVWKKISRHIECSDSVLPRVSACTVELRGLNDVDRALAQGDAAAFFDYLVDIDAVSADSTTSKPVVRDIETRRMDAVGMVVAPCYGMLVHLVPLGAWVNEGDLLAQIFDPFAGDTRTAWTAVTAPTSGVIFARSHQRVVFKGAAVCKIAGTKSLRPTASVHLLD